MHRARTPETERDARAERLVVAPTVPVVVGGRQRGEEREKGRRNGDTGEG